MEIPINKYEPCQDLPPNTVKGPRIPVSVREVAKPSQKNRPRLASSPKWLCGQSDWRMANGRGSAIDVLFKLLAMGTRFGLLLSFDTEIMVEGRRSWRG